MVRRASQDIRIRFGRAVRKRRSEIGISQEELAGRCDLHRTYVADIERGSRNLFLLSIEKVDTGLSISIGNLFSEYEID